MVVSFWVSLLPFLHPRPGTAEASHLAPPTGTGQKGSRKAGFPESKSQKKTTQNCSGNDFSAHVKLLQKTCNPSTEHRGTGLPPPTPRGGQWRLAGPPTPDTSEQFHEGPTSHVPPKAPVWPPVELGLYHHLDSSKQTRWWQASCLHGTSRTQWRPEPPPHQHQ